MDFLVRLGTSQPLTKMNTHTHTHTARPIRDTGLWAFSWNQRYLGLEMAMLRESKQAAEVYRLCDKVAYVNANAQNKVIVDLFEVSGIGGR